MYEEFKEYLEDTDVKDKFELSFVDLKNYPKEQEFIEKGHKLPLTFIEGRLAFKGAVDNKRAYMIVSKMYKALDQ